MLTATTIDAGSGHLYLSRDIAAGSDYYLAAVGAGEVSGRWIGAGSAPLLGLEGDVTSAQMDALFGLGVDPRNGEPLGKAWAQFQSFDRRIAQALRAEPGADAERRTEIIDRVRRADPELLIKVERALKREPDASPERRREIEATIRAKAARKSVAGYDLTFSAPKSVSLLAVGLDDEGRAKVWAAHHAAVDAAMVDLEMRATFTRAGAGGVRQLDVQHGLIAARFDHRTNRAGEPQMHSHVAVANKSLGVDGKWRTLDGKSLYGHAVAAGRMYRLTLEAELSRTLGVAWVDRADGYRDIDGYPDKVRSMFSTRSLFVAEQMDRLVAEYTELHGAAPSAKVRKELLARARREKRPAKGKPESTMDAVARWRQVAASNSVDLVQLAQQAINRVVDREAIREAWATLADTAASFLEADLATFTPAHALAAVRRFAPVDIDLSPAEVMARTASIADEVTARSVRLTPQPITAPERLRRKDGESQYTRHNEARHSSQALMDREREVLAIAGSQPGWRLDPAATLASIAASSCSAEQGDAVAAVLGDSSRVRVLVGPAGAGKTTTMRAVVDAAHAQGRVVVGTALSQNATSVLAEVGMDTYNVARLRETLKRDDEALPHGSILVIDECGQVDTARLGWLLREAAERDCLVIAVGDHRQLSAPEAGGGFRLLAAEVGYAELSEVRRFSAPWEGPASLRMRDGDVGVLAEYAVRHRIIDGSGDDVRGRLHSDWMTEMRRGRNVVALTATNEQASELAGELRRMLVADGRVEQVGAVLRDGNVAGVGDRVMARRNDWKARSTSGAAIINRSVWFVTGRHDDGSLTVLRCNDRGNPIEGDVATIAAGYVAEDLELAYAGTIHAAQGRTVEGSLALVADQGRGWSREHLYVAMSRGRTLNAAYVESMWTERGDQPRTVDPFSILASVMQRETGNVAALSVLADELAAAKSMRTLGRVFEDAIALDVGLRIEAAVAEVDRSAARRLRRDDGWPSLIATARTAELAGHDLRSLIRDAAAGRELPITGVSRVIEWRINTSAIAAPDEPGEVMHHPDIAPFISDVATAMERRREELITEVAPIAVAHGVSPVTMSHVAALREWRDINDPDPLSIGAKPHPFNTEEAAAHRVASIMVKRADRTADVSHDPQAWGQAVAAVDAEYPDVAAEISARTDELRREQHRLGALRQRLTVERRSEPKDRKARSAWLASIDDVTRQVAAQTTTVEAIAEQLRELEQRQAARRVARSEILHLAPAPIRRAAAPSIASEIKPLSRSVGGR